MCDPSQSKSATPSSRPASLGVSSSSLPKSSTPHAIPPTTPIVTTTAGVQACKTLTEEGTRVNVTLIFSATQAWLAAKAGASYVSPFVGRLDDIGAIGMTLVREIVDIFDSSDYATEVLVASVRSPIHVIEAARMGADVVTVPPAVIEQCFKHPLTDIGLEKFLKDWEKAQGAKV